MTITAKSADGKEHRFPDGTSQEVINKVMSDYAKASDAPAGLHFAGQGIMDAAFALPGVISEGLGNAVAAGATALGAGDGTFADRFSEQQEKFPASALRAFPKPTSNEAGAFIRSIPGLFGSQPIGERFDQELAGFEETDAAIREAQPVGSAVGDVAGDVATLLALRAPLSKPIRAFEGKLKLPDFSFGAKGLPKLEPKVSNLLTDVAKSGPVRALARGAGRTFEAGVEGAVLAMIKDGDPLETAAYTASGQAVASGLLSINKGLLSGGLFKAGGKISLAALSTAGIIQLAKDVTPGGEDTFLRSLETGYEKIALAMLFGGIAAAAGGGRLRGEGSFATNMPKLADAFATVPRAATISIVQSYLKATAEERQLIEAELNKIVENPESLANAPEMIRRALESGN